jgi:hypothetical protein
VDYIAVIGLSILAALNVLQLVFGYKERQKLLDRIQARSLPEFKAMERLENKKDEKKEPKQTFELV